MDIYTLYAGQGNFAVVVGDREAIVVDCHIPPKGDPHAEFVKASLKTIVEGKDVVGMILTGFDADHADPVGLAWVLRVYQPTWIMYPKYTKTSRTARRVFRIIRQEDARRTDSKKPLIRHSVRLDQLDKRVIDDLSHEWRFELFSPHPEDMDSSNNCSLVVKVVSRKLFGFSYLITGDTETARWDAMNRIFGKNLRAHVLAAPHHGSRTGVHDAALKHISPSVVLISAGADNQFGHPHAEALAAYRAATARVHSTHEGKSLHTYEGFFGLKTVPWSANGKTA